MATPKFAGTAVDIRQVATQLIANTWAQNDTITLTIDNLDFIVTIGTLTTTAQVATTLQQAYEGTTLTDTSASCLPTIAQGGAKSIGQFAEFTATVSGSTVTYTTNQTVSSGGVGKPVTMTAAENTAGTGTAALTLSATAARGRNEGDNQDNYSTNAVPANNDTLVFDSGNVDLLYDLSLGVQLATLTKTKGYSGKVGLREINKDNTTTGKEYREYRTKYLTTTNNAVTTTANLETGTGQGSSRFRWDAGAGRATVNIFGHGTREDTGTPCILFLGSHVSNEVNNLNGDLGIAFFPGETATIATLRNGDGESSSANTECGDGVTLTTVVCNGGTLSTTSAITTANQYGGTWSHNTGTVTATNVLGGTWSHLGPATLTALTIASGATFDASKGAASFTITGVVQMFRGSTFNDPQGRSGNVAIKLNNCSLADVTINIPPNKTITLS